MVGSTIRWNGCAYKAYKQQNHVQSENHQKLIECYQNQPAHSSSCHTKAMKKAIRIIPESIYKPKFLDSSHSASIEAVTRP